MTLSSSDSTQRPRGEFTGRKMLAVMVAGFGVIIGVNLFMAYNAVSTFPGLEVKNSYVASQDFDRARLAQERLGWTAGARMEGGQLRLSLTAADGSVPVPASLNVRIGRPTAQSQDVSPELTFDGSVWLADLALEPGSWRLWIDAVAADGTAFRQRLALEVPRG